MSEPPVQVSPEGVHPHPRHTGLRVFDLAVALTAIVISVISLFVAIEHGQVERQLVAANSWPFLQAYTSNQDDRGAARISLNIANAGVGPAKLETLELFYRGRPVASSEALFSACCGFQPPTADHGSIAPEGWITGPAGGVLRPGAVIQPLALPLTERNAAFWRRVNGALADVTYRGCYCSVFDECWISDLDSLKPTPVKACPRPAVPFRPR